MMLWSLYFAGLMFLTAGGIYFVSSTRYINFQKARYIRFDQEAAEWKEREEDRADALMEAMRMSTWSKPDEPGFNIEFKEEPGDPEVQTAGSNDMKKPLMEQFYAAPKNGRSLFDISGTYFAEAEINLNPVAMPPRDPEMPGLEGVQLKRDETFDFEESGGRKKGEQWVNFVRTYWSTSVTEQTIINDKMIYPNKLDAEESALRTAMHLGLEANTYEVKEDYSIDEALHRIIVEWITEKPESKNDDKVYETYKNAIEKND